MAHTRRLGKKLPLLRNKRKYRDVFFRTLFGEDRKALLELYNALNGTNLDNPDELTIVTIESAIYITSKNDVAFMIAGVINMYEHQTTVNPNMPARFLIYLGQEYQKIIETGNKDFYGSKRIELPTPKCVVFYNGDEFVEDEIVLKLSDAYENKNITPDAELTVRVLNVNYGHNDLLMKQCKTLSDYSRFVDRVNIYKKNNDLNIAIEKAMEYCIENDILVEFLRKHRSEVRGMLLTDFDKKKYERCQREEGREEGRVEMQIEMIGILKKIGKTPEEISELTGLELDYVMKLAEK